MADFTPSQIATSAGIGAAISEGSGLLGSLTSQLFGGWNARRQWKYQRKQMELQQQYALEQMAKQYEYQQQMFDYENAYNDPSKVMERYRNAGINPAAVMGSSGASMAATNQTGGSVGTPPGPSGGPAVGAGAPSQPVDPLAASQIAVNQSQAEKNQSDSIFTQDSILTSQATRRLLGAQVDNVQWDSYVKTQEAEIARIEASNKQDEIDARIGNMISSTNNFISQAALNDEQAKLVRRQAACEIARIKLLQSEVRLNNEQCGYIHILSKGEKLNYDAASQTFRIPVVDGSGKPVLLRDNEGRLVTDQEGNPRHKYTTVNGPEAMQAYLRYQAVSAGYQIAVDQIEGQWAETRQKFQNVRDVSAALSGIIGSFGFAKGSFKSSTLGRGYREYVTNRHGEVIRGTYRETF